MRVAVALHCELEVAVPHVLRPLVVQLDRQSCHRLH